MKGQINFNTGLVTVATIIFGVVADVGCRKVDNANVSLIQHELILRESKDQTQKLEKLIQEVISKQTAIDARLIDFERQIKDLVTRGEFNSEVNRLHQEIEFMKRKS